MRRFFEDKYAAEEFNQQGSGSGVIMNKDGYILTNNHVVANADELDVTLYDGRTATAELIGRDEDLTSPSSRSIWTISPAKFGDSDKLEVGEWVLAAGNPFQLTSSITSGIVSAKGRSRIGLANYEDFIQTDAAINPGTRRSARQPGCRGNRDQHRTGYAIGRIPGDSGSRSRSTWPEFAQDLISHGKVTRGFLGVTIRDLDDVMADYYGLAEPRGSLVQAFTGRPADRAGLKQRRDHVRQRARSRGQR
ncbi:MAG: trypsin-like peptidase domain-containing protein [Candidatus Eisenbacteria bacterium]